MTEQVISTLIRLFSTDLVVLTRLLPYGPPLTSRRYQCQLCIVSLLNAVWQCDRKVGHKGVHLAYTGLTITKVWGELSDVR